MLGVWGSKTHLHSMVCRAPGAKGGGSIARVSGSFLAASILRGFPQGKNSEGIFSKEIQTERGGGGEFLRMCSVRKPVVCMFIPSIPC